MKVHGRNRAKELGWQPHKDEDEEQYTGEDDNSASISDVVEMLLGDCDSWLGPVSSKPPSAENIMNKTFCHHPPTRNQDARVLSIQSLLNEPALEPASTESRSRATSDSATQSLKDILF